MVADALWRRRRGTTYRTFDPLPHAAEVALVLGARNLTVADVAFDLTTLRGALLGRHRGGLRRRRLRRRLARRWLLVPTTRSDAERDGNQELGHTRILLIGQRNFGFTAAASPASIRSTPRGIERCIESA
jgi:hypothetical protein